MNLCLFFKKQFRYLFAFLFFSSCVVTNNLYINDPLPVQDIGQEFYWGVGTGTKPKVESVDMDGKINFSNDLEMAPNFYLGGQVKLIDKLDLRFSMHLPYVIAGFGLRAGPQYSFFSRESKLNLAIGTDLGFTLAKDSLSILGSANALDVHANGAINADFFVPFSYSFNENYRIILTPRISFNTFYIRENTNYRDTRKFKPQIPSLALGLRLDKVYLEASGFWYQDAMYPNFGIVYIF
jgi:hypothetical protein